jgi:transmembrane protein
MAGVELHPAWAFAVLTIFVEIGASLLVIVNRWTWLSAWALGVLTVLAIFLAHRFWDADGPLRGEQFNTFLEHAGLAAAFILVAALSMLRDRDDRP